MATSDIPVAVVLDEAGCANGDRMQELQDERQRKLMEFGWSASYGAMTSMEKGNVKRAEAECKADEWFFCEIGKMSTTGRELLAIRGYFKEVCEIFLRYSKNEQYLFRPESPITTNGICGKDKSSFRRFAALGHNVPTRGASKWLTC